MIRKLKVKVAPKPVIKKHIDTDFIRLDAFLKYCDVVGSGGMAKMIIQDGAVKVNGEVCTSRGKKLRVGDSAEFENKIYTIE